jgi:hypothetical protein
VKFLNFQNILKHVKKWGGNEGWEGGGEGNGGMGDGKVGEMGDEKVRELECPEVGDGESRGGEAGLMIGGGVAGGQRLNYE